MNKKKKKKKNKERKKEKKKMVPKLFPVELRSLAGYRRVPFPLPV